MASVLQHDRMVCAWLAVDRLTRELIRKQGLFRFLSSVLVGRIPGPEEECFHPGIHVGSDVPLVSLCRAACLTELTSFHGIVMALIVVCIGVKA